MIKIKKMLLIFCLLFLLPAKAADLNGEISFALTPNENVSEYSFTDVYASGTSSGYSSVNISYPYELQMNYNGALLSSSNKPAGWVITISAGAGSATSISVIISAPANNGTAANIENFFKASSFTLKTAGVYPPAGSGVEVMVSEQVIAQFKDAEGGTHVYEFIEYEKQADKSVLTWLQAYNEARGRVFSGKHGHLATLTSIEEQMFVYDSIAQKPGWLGGTTLRGDSAGAPMIDGKTDISENIGDYTSGRDSVYSWYWADGPEAGTVFYNRPVRDDTNGPVPDVFNFFSNGWTYNRYPQYHDQIQNGREPNGDGGECCLQFAWSNKASWNDLTNNSRVVQGYYVEYDFFDGLLSSSGVLVVEIPIPLTVSFNTCNGDYTGTVADQTVLTGKAAIPPAEFTPGCLYANYGNKKFLGWFENPADTDPFDFFTPVTASNTQNGILSLYGKWEQYYDVFFTNTGNRAVPVQTITENGTASEPDSSGWSDFRFNFYGWSKNGADDYSGFTPFDFSEPIKGDTVLYGIWDPVIYSLIFDPNGGSWNDDFTLRTHEYCPGADDPFWEDYDPSHLPDAPSRPEYVFNCWIDENNIPPPDFAAVIIANNTYFAQWDEEIPEKENPAPSRPAPSPYPAGPEPEPEPETEFESEPEPEPESESAESETTTDAALQQSEPEPEPEPEPEYEAAEPERPLPAEPETEPETPAKTPTESEPPATEPAAEVTLPAEPETNPPYTKPENEIPPTQPGREPVPVHPPDQISDFETERSPETGENGYLIFWIVFLVIAGAVTVKISLFPLRNFKTA